MNTKLIGSLIGYTINNTMSRAIVLNSSNTKSWILVKDENSNRSIIINKDHIKWING